MAIDIDKFVHDQLSVWPAVAAKYRALKSAQTRQMTIGGILVTLQSNPGRLPIFDHGCPLCEENYLDHQHFLPFEGRKGRKYRILVNRAPIFPNHLVITRDVHVPQTIWHRYPDMLDLAVQFPDYVIFYNSPYSGTTVPGHAHFQACPKGYMPLERIAGRLLHNIAMNGGQVPESLSANVSFVDSVRDAQLFHYKHFTRGVFLLRAETAKSMAKMFYRLLDCCDLAEGEMEPRFNALTFFSEGEYRAVVMCRAAHRPHHFYAEGEEHFALSPGAADMAGFFVIPEVSDYERLTPKILTDILQEISLSEKQEERLLWRLVRTQPKIEVGILSGPEITFEIISDGAGPQKVSYREGKIDYNGTLYDELVFEAPTISTLFAEPSFILYGVTIGVDFHWQRQQDQQFAGTLKFIVDEGKVVAVNVIGVEDYLLSVISSEMKATASPEFLKAHAVISRSWVMAQIAHRKARKKASAPYSFDNVPSLVTWLDASRPAEAGQPVGEIIKWFDHGGEGPRRHRRDLGPHPPLRRGTGGRPLLQVLRRQDRAFLHGLGRRGLSIPDGPRRPLVRHPRQGNPLPGPERLRPGDGGLPRLDRPLQARGPRRPHHPALRGGHRRPRRPRTPRAGRLRPHQETPHRRFQDHAHRRQGTDYPPLPLRKPPVQLLVRRGDDGR